MLKISRILAIFLVLLALALPSFVHAQPAAHVDVLTVGGAIDQWVDGYIDRGISVAEQDGAQAAIIVLNTPGGALGAMQDITTRMLNARVPLVVYVSPQGAWAGSAGTFITLAANVAVMAPSTTIGAAHPVDSAGQNISSDERDKITNFSIGIIKNIARTRNRNDVWAADAVQNSKAATAQEALDLKVIDFIATDMTDLLRKMDGRVVKTASGDVTLHSQGAEINNLDMNLTEVFLHTIVDPNLALILLQIGMLAIAVELYNPGATLPAIVGVICLVLAFIVLYNLPVNWGGVILIMLSVVAFVIDVKVNSIVLTGGAIIMFILGGLLLYTPFTPIAPTMPQVSISPWLVVGLAGAMAVFFVFLLGAAVRGRKFPVVSGPEALVGAVGVATSELNPEGTVRVKSEVWTANALGDIIHRGEAVQIVRIEGLRAQVVKKQDNK